MKDFFRVRGWRAFFLAFSLVILSAILFSSCDSGIPEPVGTGVMVRTDSVTYLTSIPITAPRFSCSGKELQYPKYLGSESREVVIPWKWKHIPDSVLMANGYYYLGKGLVTQKEKKQKVAELLNEGVVKKEKGNSSVLAERIQGILDWLIPLALLCFAIPILLLLLYKIIKFLSEHSFTAPERSNYIVPGSQEQEVSENKELYAHIETVIETLQQTGGRVVGKFGNSEYEVAIPEQKENQQAEPAKDIESKEEKS